MKGYLKCLEHGFGTDVWLQYYHHFRIERHRRGRCVVEMGVNGMMQDVIIDPPRDEFGDTRWIEKKQKEWQTIYFPLKKEAI